EGAEVELLLHLTFDGKVSGVDEADADSALSRDARRRLRVFPKPETLNETEKLRDAISSANAPESERVVLPETVDGQKVRWIREGKDPGVTVLAIGLVLGIGLLFNAVQQAGKAAEERQRRLSLDYPYVVSRLTLYLGAGMSLRSAFVRMAGTYEEALRGGGGKREAMEEIRRVAAELQNGASETEAIRQFGERSGNARYRTLAQLLLQHLSRGNRELAILLAEDSREAFEERKKEARIRGEQAGTKLIFPMLLMLGVVIAILLVPAVVNFM
ncbi:MAG: type II secretion system F family protein, partial [bacterium]